MLLSSQSDVNKLQSKAAGGEAEEELSRLNEQLKSQSSQVRTQRGNYCATSHQK